jgi:hypothetical protein
MSYYIPLPDLKAAGLCKVWEALDVVARIITQDGNFHIALPVEFRFIKGGDSAMSGAYSDDPNTWFLNVEYGAFVDRTKKASEYPPKLLKFFAEVERQWVAMEGIPHGGKMYGFYDPTEGPDTYSKTGPFNPNFLASVRERRGAARGVQGISPEPRSERPLLQRFSPSDAGAAVGRTQSANLAGAQPFHRGRDANEELRDRAGRNTR